jgi:peptide chain release factor
MEKIIQITSGRGPAECTWVAAQVLKKVLQEAEVLQLNASVLQHEPGQENGSVASAMVKINGKNVDAFVALWVGTIQWIGKSTFRKFHKRSNWFIGIFEVNTTQEIAFSGKEIQYQAIRSSGAGGQHVNKVSSAIRATHIPTGTAVVSMDSRSQHQNKKIATERLLEKLRLVEIEQIKNRFQIQWTNQMAIQRGNPIRVFEVSDFRKLKILNKNKKDRQHFKNDLNQEIKNENNR